MGQAPGATLTDRWGNGGTERLKVKEWGIRFHTCSILHATEQGLWHKASGSLVPDPGPVPPTPGAHISFAPNPRWGLVLFALTEGTPAAGRSNGCSVWRGES
jgi:hypothetical protein